MAEATEPRALAAALAAPMFATRNNASAMHVANRHVERWAPEADPTRVRPMRSLGFVDRLVAPWMETAQRSSSSLRMFSQYLGGGIGERAAAPVSWVFPRPWYQDELDWMAAARHVGTQAAVTRAAAPSLLTTRATYVPPAAMSRQAPAPIAMPAQLYEYVAPSLSVAAPTTASMASSAAFELAAPSPRSPHAGSAREMPYSSLVPFAATHAAEVMARAVAPLVGPGIGRMSPNLRAVLTAVLERATRPASEPTATRAARTAPELVTPPAPVALRDDAATTQLDVEPAAMPASATVAAPAQAMASPATAASATVDRASALAAESARYRERIVELQRVARATAAHEVATREAAAREAAAASVASSQLAATPAPARATSATQLPGAEAARGDDRAVVEERIARRLAERVREAEQRARDHTRLHETSREAAARDARAAIQPLAVPTAAPTVSAREPERRSAEPLGAAVAASIAALPPELSALVAHSLSRRPAHATQAIAELGEALRAVELIAQNTAAGRGLEPTRGPRLMMPAGLGGLASTIEHTTTPARAVDPGAPHAARPTAMPAAFAAAERAAMYGRVPALSWLAARPSVAATGASPYAATGASPYAATGAFGSTGSVVGGAALAHDPRGALAAATTNPPTALHHVAWADRWLARFAGARTHSLDTLAASSAAPELRFAALAAAAPASVFVAFAGDDAVAGGSAAASSASPGRARGATPLPERATAATRPPVPAEPRAVERYDDAAETPDDVFAAIASAATRSRGLAAATAARAATIAATPAGASAPSLEPAALPRETYADLVSRSVPAAPNAGLSAELASSPFAPGLRHLLPIGVTPEFDVRALFSDNLVATYLSGLLAPATHAVDIAAPFAPSFAAMASIGGELDRDAPLAREWDPTYVATDERAWRADELGALEVSEASAELGTSTSTSTSASASPSAPAPATAATAAQLEPAFAHLTTLRSALLATRDLALAPASVLDAAASAESFSYPLSADELAAAPTRATSRPAFAHTLLDATAFPLLGDAPRSEQLASAAWMQPGAIGERARGWSVAQERSAADLSYDFVTPELVLAARVYGLGPAEAAQAARLALAGPGQLAAMAGAVDRTFVQMLAIDAERRDGERALATAYPSARGHVAAFATPGVAGESARAERAESGAVERATAVERVTAVERAAVERATAVERAPMAALTTAAFGVDRRAPRGAFLWPAATVGALGLHAAAPDGQLSMSVAALELLATRAVAEIGTYAAIGGEAWSERDDGTAATTREPLGRASFAGLPGIAELPGVAAALAGAPTTGATDPSAALVRAADSTAAATAAAGEPAEPEVLASATRIVATARRAKFEALYAALGESPAGRGVSPAARAARALALAGRGDDTITARERAAIAWDVLPLVFGARDPRIPGSADIAVALDDAGQPIDPRAPFAATTSAGAAPQLSYVAPGPGSTPARAGRAANRTTATTADRAGALEHVVTVDARPGLAALSARAGEALGSYVTPSAEPAAAATPAREPQGAMLRAPTAAQELVRTGRPSGRHGGGEVEIPPWFEAAARKMLDDRSGAADGISLAELTLVSAAPPAAIAASTRAMPSAMPATPAPSKSAGLEKQLDIEKVANEVYRQILALMDVARARNGEPYL